VEWPFLGTEALAAGAVNRYQLSTRHDALYRNVYVPGGQAVTAADRAVGAWLWSGRRATVAGLSAAALHGAKWIDATLPAELNQSSRHKTTGIRLHSDALADDEICQARGVPATTPARTAFDLGRRKGLTTAVVRIDALRQATRLTARDVETLVERHGGARGVVQLRKALALSDAGAESPQETRTRLLLTAAGLRPTHTQIEVFDHYEFVGRIDMGYLRWKVGVEYDGPQHWTDPSIRNRDLERRAGLSALGWRIVHVNAEMLRYRPAVIVGRTEAALRDAGATARRT
jgi:very-short-patch-repair endonuclease